MGAAGCSAAGGMGACPRGAVGYRPHGSPCLHVPRTLTQEDPGDNQTTLEEIMQMVSQAHPSRDPRTPSLSMVTPPVSHWPPGLSWALGPDSEWG